MTRAQLRIGSGKGTDVADEHVHEMLGSSELYVYVTPGIKPKGYAQLKSFLEAAGCEVRVSHDAPMLPAKGYKAVRITHGGQIVRGLNTGKGRVVFRRRNAFAVDLPFKIVPDGGKGAGDRVLGNIAQNNVVTGQRTDMRNAVAHLPRADYADGLNLH